jgi:hypothetical protein
MLSSVWRIVVAGLLTLLVAGCGGNDSSGPIMVEQAHSHYHVHAVDASHQHSHADGAMVGHVHSHQHSERKVSR